MSTGARRDLPAGARAVLATHSAGKLRELQRLLAERLPGIAPDVVVSAGELGLPDVREDGTSFEQNALKKARAASAATGLLAIADDSGLQVDVMGGSPGIFSARWAGRHGDDAANNALLLAQLADVPAEHRGAQFRCTAVIVAPDGREIIETGVMRGRLLREPRGTDGFGYDPLFVPEDADGRTSAELSPAEKDAISHRGIAMRALAAQLAELLA